MKSSLAQRTAVECLGTAFLLAAVVGSGIMAAKLAGGNGALALLCNTLPTGTILAVLILTLGPISGAHFNPAVSLAAALRGEMTVGSTAIYVGAQVVGGILGVWAAHLMFELPVWQISVTTRTGPGQWLAEAVATFGLLVREARRPFRMRSAFTSPRPIGSRRRHLSPIPPLLLRDRFPTRSRVSLPPVSLHLSPHSLSACSARSRLAAGFGATDFGPY